jgi:hypothetical protein
MKLRGMLLATAALAAPLLNACSNQSNHSPSAGEIQGTGEVSMQLRLPDGTTLNSVNYDITQTGSSYSNTGSVNLANSTTPRFQVGSIPAGVGYGIGLTGTTSAGVTCSTATPQPFDIQAGVTTAVNVALRCGTGGTTVVGATAGNVRVTVDVTQAEATNCPTINGLTALPLEVIVGNPVSLIGYATLPSATFAWAAAPTSGSFSAPSAASTTFTPGAVGSYIVTLSVSGGTACQTYTDTVEVVSSADPNGVVDAGPDAEVDAGPDAEIDAAPDAEIDAAPDAEIDAAPDAGPDAEPDAAPDAGPDAEIDAAPDAEADAGPDATTDAGDGGGGPTACELCQRTSCRDVLGVDMYAGCFTAIDPQFGATAGDPVFIQQCVDTVQCASRGAGCGFTEQFQAAECYCGTNSGDPCTTAGPALNAPCLKEWRYATRVAGDEADPANPTAAEIAADNATVQLRFSDLAFPAGWAYFLIDCSRNSCASVCDPTP